MPLPKINKATDQLQLACADNAKVFKIPQNRQKQQSRFLQCIDTTNWQTRLLQVLAQYDQVSSQRHWKQWLDKHLASPKPAMYTEALTIIYGRLTGQLDHILTPIDKNIGQSIVSGLKQDIAFCTPGFWERVLDIANSMQLTVQNIDDCLYLAYLDLIERVASQHIEDYRNQQYDRHHYSEVFFIAHQQGLRNDKTPDKIVHSTLTNQRKPKIKQALFSQFNHHFQYYKWPQLILDQYIANHLIHHGYVGRLQEGSYDIGDCKKFLQQIAQLLNIPDDTTITKPTPGYNLIIQEHDDEIGFDLVDINWQPIKQRLFNKLISQGLIVDPEPDYTQIAHDCDEFNKAVYYLLALMINNPEDLPNYLAKLTNHPYCQSVLTTAIAEAITYNSKEIELFINRIQHSLDSSKVLSDSLTQIDLTDWHAQDINALLRAYYNCFKNNSSHYHADNVTNDDHFKAWLIGNEQQLSHFIVKNIEGTLGFLAQYLDHEFNAHILRHHQSSFSPQTIWHIAVQYFDACLLDHLATVKDNSIPEWQAKNQNGETALQWAIRCRKPHAVETLLRLANNKEGPVQILLENRNHQGETALHLAAQLGEQHIIEILAHYHAEINAEDNYQSTPLHHAVEHNQTDVIASLINHGANTCHVNQDQNTALKLALDKDFKKTSLQIVKCLSSDLITLQRNLDYNKEPAYLNNDLLTIVAISNEPELLLQLLKLNHLNINMRSDHGYTLLHDATACGHFDIVKILLSSDHIEPESQDYLGRTALYHACQSNFTDIVQLFYEYNPHLFHLNSPITGKNGAHIAAIQGHTDIINQLIDYAPDMLNVLDIDGYTPAHYAALYGHINIIKLLSNRLSQVLYTTNQTHYTVLHSAVSTDITNMPSSKLTENKQAIISCLTQQGWDINLVTSSQDTPLGMAIHDRQADLAQFILQNYAHKLIINAVNDQGKSLLTLALENDLPDIAQGLLKLGANFDDIKQQAWREDSSNNELHYLAQYEHYANLIDGTNDLGQCLQTNRRGETPLLVAAKYNNIQALEKLINQFQHVLLKPDEHGQNIAYYLVQHHQDDMFDTILRQNNQTTNNNFINSIANNNLSPIQLAYRQDQVSFFEIAYQHNLIKTIPLTTCLLARNSTQHRQSLITWLIERGQPAIVESILNSLHEPEIIKLLNQKSTNATNYTISSLFNDSYCYLIDSLSSNALHKIDSYIINDSHNQLTLARVLLQQHYQININTLADYLDKILDSTFSLNQDIHQSFHPNNLLVHDAAAIPNQDKSLIIQQLMNRLPWLLNKRNDRGQTPLHLAVMHNNIHHVQTLLRLKADLDIPNLHGQTPLKLARENRNEPIIQAIADHQHPFNQITTLIESDLTGFNILDLIHADISAKQALEVFIYLTLYKPHHLPHYYSKIAHNNNLQTIIDESIEFIHYYQPKLLPTVIYHLLASEQSPVINSLMNYTARCNDITCFKIIAQININLIHLPIDKRGNTILHLAAQYSNTLLLSAALQDYPQFVNLRQTNAKQQNPLHSLTDPGNTTNHSANMAFFMDAAFQGFTQPFEICLEDRDLLASEFWQKGLPDTKQLITHAGSQCQADTAPLIMKLISEIDRQNREGIFSILSNSMFKQRDKYGCLPSHYLAMNSAQGHQILEALKQAQIPLSLDAHDQYGFTALHYATVHNSLVASQLITEGADVNAKNNYRFNILNHAAYHGLTDIVARLLNHNSLLLDQYTRHPILDACEGGFQATVELIYHHDPTSLGAIDPLTMNNGAHLAIKEGHIAIFNFFKTHLPELLGYFNKQGFTPIELLTQTSTIHLNDSQILLNNKEAILHDALMGNPQSLSYHEAEHNLDLLTHLLSYAIMQKQAPIAKMLLTHLKSLVTVKFHDFFSSNSANLLKQALDNGLSDIASEIINLGGPGYIIDDAARQNDSRQNTLHFLAKYHNSQLIATFIQSNNAELSTLEAINSFNETPLLTAARYKNLDALQYFLESNVNLLASDNQGRTILHHLVNTNNADYFAKVLAQLNDSDCKTLLNLDNQQNITPLQQAYKNGQIEFFDILTQANCIKHITNWEFNPQIHNRSNQKPLLKWLNNNHCYNALQAILNHAPTQKACKLMLQSSIKSASFLSDAFQNGSLQAFNNISAHLIEQLNQTITQNNFPKPNLGHWLVQNRDRFHVIPLIYSLIQRQDQGDIQTNLFRQIDKKGRLPLHVAISNSCENTFIVNLLAQKYPQDLDHYDYDGDTPLHIAVKTNNLPVAKVLLSLDSTGKHLKNCDQQGETPLHIVASTNNQNMAELLLSKESANESLAIVNNYGQTALQIAQMHHCSFSHLFQYETNQNNVAANNYTFFSQHPYQSLPDSSELNNEWTIEL